MSSQSSTPPIMHGERSLGVHPYNVPCLMFFTITGLILQIPVIYTHCGLFSRPNIPVVVMSACYIYLMVSFTVAADYWHSPNTSAWWDGSGWCDLDVRVFMAISLCVLSSQCVINWNIVQLLGERPRLISGSRIWIRGSIELACCLFLPVISLATSTFLMQRRYEIIQDIGCSAALDTSIALIVTYVMWIPILGATALVTMLYIAYRFWKRGRRQAMETVSFIPNMSPSQFLRIIIFSVAVTFILVPLSMSTAVINLINIDDYGVHAIAWAHGKPKEWDEVAAASLDEVAAVVSSTDRASFIVTFITRYINIAIAWLLFICYGTGILAVQAYKTAFHTVTRTTEKHDYDEEPSDLVDDYSMSPSSPHEWDPNFSGAQALKEWEAGLKMNGTTEFIAPRASPTSSLSRKHAGDDPERLALDEAEVSGGRKFPLREFLAGKGFFGHRKA